VQLKASFLENFGVGQKRKEELLSVHKALQEERDSLNNTQVQLIAARDHVKDTFLQLGKRLHGLRVFARKLDAIAATTLKDAAVPSQHSQKIDVLTKSNDSDAMAQAPSTMPSTTTTSTVTTTTTTKTKAAIEEKTTPPAAKVLVASKAHGSQTRPSTKAEPKPQAQTPPVASADNSVKAMKQPVLRHHEDVPAKVSAFTAVPAKKAPADQGKTDHPASGKASATKTTTSGAVSKGVESRESPKKRKQMALFQAEASSPTTGEADAQPKSWPVFDFLRWR